MTAQDERLNAIDSALARIRQIGEDPVEPEVESFGLWPLDLPDRFQDQWNETIARLRALLNRFSHLAAAQSAYESGVQARSVIGWTGDLATVWSGTVRPEHRRAHFALLDADLRYRGRMILIVTTALAAAASICAAAALPLKAPAAFRSLAKLVSELQNLGQVAESG